MRRQLGRRVRTVAFALAAWTLFGLFQFSRDLAVLHRWSIWRPLLAIELIVAYTFFFITPLAFWLGRRYPIKGLRHVRRLALHAVLGVGVSLFVILVFTGIVLASGTASTMMKMSFAGVFKPAFFTGIHIHALTYWLLILIQHSLDYHRREHERERRALQFEIIDAELQTQLKQVQLRTLRTQLQPHFLFNVLNSIMVLVRQQLHQQAVDMLCRLKDLLRRALDHANDQEVPLRRELELVELYLTIEQVRFQDRLRVEMAVDPELLDAAVPSLSLQPLVENAIHRGIARRSLASLITIRAFRVEEMLRLEVQDEGPGIDGQKPASGIGLTNTRLRLQYLYGEASRVSVETARRGGTIATIVIPYRSTLHISAAKPLAAGPALKAATT